MASVGREATLVTTIARMSGPNPIQVWIEIDDAEVEEARHLADARLSDVGRHQSVHRPTSRNAAAQFRGAAGELAARRWLRSNGFNVSSGFELDLPLDSDLTVGSIRIEVMTAQISHREITGFCVPPSKLKAAVRRGAVGYLFVGTGQEVEPRRFLMQGFCRLDVVDRVPPVETRVHNSSPGVLNHVVPNTNIEPVNNLIIRLTASPKD